MSAVTGPGFRRARHVYGESAYTLDDVPRPPSACRHLGPLFTVLAMCGCAAPPPLAASAASPRQLAEQVLVAIAANDRSALERLALSEAEFRDHVWPHLPAARPERNLPFGYVWSDLRQKSAAGLGVTLTRHRDRAYELLDVRFDGGRTPYTDVVVHRGAVFDVRGPDGQEEIRVCGSFLEKGGRWKVFSYVVDD